MADDPMISFKEAAELAGMSKKTIERFYKKHKDDSAYADAFEHRSNATGPKYFIREGVVLRDIRKGALKQSTSEGNSTAAQDAVREVVNQLAIKDKQLEKKDQQIERLQDNLHQEQILHLRSQEQNTNPLRKLFGPKQAREVNSSTPKPTDAVGNAPAIPVRVIVLLTLAATLALIQVLKMALPLFL